MNRARGSTGLDQGRLVVIAASASAPPLPPTMLSGEQTRDTGKAVALFLSTLRSATLAEGYMQSYPINLRRNLCGSGSPGSPQADSQSGMLLSGEEGHHTVVTVLLYLVGS